MKSKFTPWLVMAVIFVAGILTGAALTMVFHPRFEGPPVPRDMPQHWLAHLTQQLKLTPDQQTKILPILVESVSKVAALHRDEMEHGSQIFKATNEQISALLTPEQKEALGKMEAERMKVFAGHMHPWGVLRAGPGGPPFNAPPDENGQRPPPPPLPPGVPPPPPPGVLPPPPPFPSGMTNSPPPPPPPLPQGESRS